MKHWNGLIQIRVFLPKRKNSLTTLFLNCISFATGANLSVFRNTIPGFFLFLFLGTFLWALPLSAKDYLSGEDNVPYGAAADYLIGRQLLKDGKYAEALGYLHLVYRTHPDVPAIAIDFQDALVAEGYFKDALGVMNRLVATHPDSVAYLLQRSNLNIKLGKTDEALKDLRDIRSRGEASLDVIMAEASLLAAQGQVNQALDVYQDGLITQPENGHQMYLGMASLLQQDNRVGDVPDLMEQAVNNYPASPQLWLVWARSLALTGQHDAALKIAKDADQNFAGDAYPDRAEDPDLNTDPDFMNPLEDIPDSFQVELADFYAQQGEVARSVVILKNLRAAEKLDVTPSLWLARLYLGTGQVDLGRELIDDIVLKWPTSGRGWFLKGKLDEEQDNWTDAIALFEKAAELEPYDPEIRLALLRSMLVGWDDDLLGPNPTALQKERREKVEKQAVAAMTIIPDQDSEGQLVLGYAFRTLLDPWRAEGCFAKAAENPDVKISAVTQQSLCLDEMNEPEKARRVLEELQKQYPTHPEVANSLGYFLAEKGEDLDQAVDLIQLALNAEPGNGAFLDSMGWALYRQGQIESAFDFMIQAVNVLPDDPVILEHLGMVLLKMGQKDEAVGMLQRSLLLGGDRDRLKETLHSLGIDTEPAPSVRQP